MLICLKLRSGGGYFKKKKKTVSQMICTYACTQPCSVWMLVCHWFNISVLLLLLLRNVIKAATIELPIGSVQHSTLANW